MGSSSVRKSPPDASRRCPWYGGCPYARDSCRYSWWEDSNTASRAGNTFARSSQPRDRPYSTDTSTWRHRRRSSRSSWTVRDWSRRILSLLLRTRSLLSALHAHTTRHPHSNARHYAAVRLVLRNLKPNPDKADILSRKLLKLIMPLFSCYDSLRDRQTDGRERPVMRPLGRPHKQYTTNYRNRSGETLIFISALLSFSVERRSASGCWKAEVWQRHAIYWSKIANFSYPSRI